MEKVENDLQKFFQSFWKTQANKGKIAMKRNRLSRLADHMGISSQALAERIERRRNSLDCEILFDKKENELAIWFGYTRNDMFNVSFDLEEEEIMNLIPSCLELGKKALGIFLAFDFELMNWGQRYDFEMPLDELEENYLSVPVLDLTESEREEILTAVKSGFKNIALFAKANF